jgi:dipeptidyl aminopeptidase/acylaminoacyl peptidase
MGEVYRARDTRLGRDVALKVLPAHLSDSPTLRQRLEREARAVSSLSHPHICTLHDIGREDEIDFLVMEYLEGETLADRLGKGRVPLGQALRYAGEIADALDTAHRHGVIHRDLKPGNVMLTRSGAKLLDFGLAKVRETGADSDGESLSKMPTQARPLTEEGKIVGTYPYMAPEQLEGKGADARTDVFAFGAMLYEMVTGRRAFEGDSRASLIAAILSSQPRPIEELEPMTPPLLDRVVRRCLEKNPNERWQSAADLRADLKWVAEGVAQSRSVTSAARPWRRHLVWAGVCGALLLGLLFAILTPSGPRDAPVRRFAFTETAPVRSAVISPDGQHIAYVLGRAPDTMLWVRNLDHRDAREIEGSQGALHPFWSPDSESIGFFAGRHLKKVPRRGDSPITLCELPYRTPKELEVGFGAWGPDGRSIIVSALSDGFDEIPARGGQPTPLLRLDPLRHGFFFMPHIVRRAGSGNVLLFSVGDFVRKDIVVQDLKTGERRVLASGTVDAPFYSHSGHVLYHDLQSSTVFALPFSLDNLRATGEAFPIAQSARLPSVAADGTLLVCDAAPQRWQLVLRDRTGAHLGFVGQAQDRLYIPRLSPDGRRVGVGAWEEDVLGLWIHEVDRPVRSRLTLGPVRPTSGLVWSPSGDRVAFSGHGPGSDGSLFGDIFVKLVAGSGDPQPIASTPKSDLIADWSPDGRHLVFAVGTPAEGGADLQYLAVPNDRKDRQPEIFVSTPAYEGVAQFSADGLFVAFISDESGRHEVYVRRFPTGDDKVQVSTRGACQVRWGRNGEIFYVELVKTGDVESVPSDVGTLVAVPVETQPTLKVGTPERLFESPGLTEILHPGYDVFPDGRRFVVREPVGSEAAPVIRVIQNWYAEFSDHDAGSEE